MRYVYVVEGSEDGVVGVFSSYAKARNCAISYFGNIGMIPPISYQSKHTTEYFYASTRATITRELVE